LKKIAFVFSGQGAQTKGMGLELFQNFEEVKPLIAAANQAGIDILKLCLETEDEELSKTIHSQPAIFAVSLAAFLILKNNGINPSCVAGFSLGECSALTAAGVLSLEDGFFLIKERALAMQSAAQKSTGAMFAVIGLDTEVLQKLCDEVNGFCTPVNYNCPSQTVIAGDEAACATVAQKALEAGAMKAVRLSVNAAFHTKLMESAANEFKDKISSLNFAKPNVSLYSNTTAEKMEEISDVPAYLAKQMTNAVLWQKTIENMIEDGVDTFVECGTGKTLAGLIKRINKTVKVLNIQDEKSAWETIEALKIHNS
jgi:[acyl-carrier-protein] S-malonyltransferase